ncbi:protocatechuate 3,4-dioxygenase beta subunit [Caulobacter ginsengisoli]|uniref:Protocatechuate 3,4-dioxygenase beta subunit n=1 Tax=Caulobacter ginsengisoli TaxID=400775 RepID=A0ABU0IV27_9CAUL|nr:carboxypeptidase-like regulatory domain-containing protein [Caulobacter ginsengisoli]MDQ0465873.1 protocatechuate 3,4-dioxygenase beta subunit [Caulobacter ginsengisoli]
MALTDSGDPQAGSLAGQVLDDETSAPVAGAAILVREGGGEWPATADAQGQFAFAYAAPGFYTVEARHDGYRRGDHGVEVTAGAQAQVVLRLTPLRSG